MNMAKFAGQIADQLNMPISTAGKVIKATLTKLAKLPVADREKVMVRYRKRKK